MMNCIIIDDEPLAREGLADYVRDINFLRLIGTCEDPVQLIQLLDQHPTDLLFLDIQMPKMSGIDFLKTMQNPPLVIVTTAFQAYAIESFQLNVMDYLLKPITFNRFLKSVNKARDYYQLVTNSHQTGFQKTPPVDYFFIKCGRKYEKIQFDEILYIEGMQNYVSIYTARGKFFTMLLLKNLEDKLDSKAFIRVHKSYIVPIGKIESIESNLIFIQSCRIPISRNYREQVIEQVIANKLWDKIKFS